MRGCVHPGGGRTGADTTRRSVACGRLLMIPDTTRFRFAALCAGGPGRWDLVSGCGTTARRRGGPAYPWWPAEGVKIRGERSKEARGPRPGCADRGQVMAGAQATRTRKRAGQRRQGTTCCRARDPLATGERTQHSDPVAGGRGGAGRALQEMNGRATGNAEAAARGAGEGTT